MARALVGTLSDVEEVRLVLVGQELLRFEENTSQRKWTQMRIACRGLCKIVK